VLLSSMTRTLIGPGSRSTACAAWLTNDLPERLLLVWILAFSETSLSELIHHPLQMDGRRICGSAS
jgi:hypothetical protein